MKKDIDDVVERLITTVDVFRLTDANIDDWFEEGNSLTIEFTKEGTAVTTR